MRHFCSLILRISWCLSSNVGLMALYVLIPVYKRRLTTLRLTVIQSIGPWFSPILRVRASGIENSRDWQGSNSIGTVVHLWFRPSRGLGWKPWIPNQGCHPTYVLTWSPGFKPRARHCKPTLRITLLFDVFAADFPPHSTME